MSENKKRFNPWIPTVILGVVAVLFSFYALQVQSELQDAKKRLEESEARNTTCEKAAIQQIRNLQVAAEYAREQLEKTKLKLAEYEKSKSKK